MTVRANEIRHHGTDDSRRNVGDPSAQLEPVVIVRARLPLVRQRAYFVPGPEQRGWGPDRTAFHEVVATIREEAWSWQQPVLTGLHGVIRRPRPPEGPAMAPFYTSTRVLRSAPATAWDAGTALNAAGLPAGREE